MALPPGFLDELRNRVPISQIVGRNVTWDRRKSNHARGDLWACCPFHDEKSPSFHVDDRKGYYHCFGCGAKGDAVTFLREQENMSFIEAVTELAREAGLPMPEQDPAAAAKAQKARSLADWMEEAVRFYRGQLMGGGGSAARQYLDGRGLSSATVERFEIGFAPASRRALLTHLTGRGATPAALAEAGLIGMPEDGQEPYDRFRDRIMFPIRDASGRCIAFGARAMRDGQEPKYLNSPETPLFDKSRTLFNIANARRAAGRAGRLIVVEGYMDAIALAQAGFDEAVAPLGTALTEFQLEMIWRLSPEPVLALDGDEAGLRAAYRAIDLALPRLGPARTLRIALLPQGQDPDDLARQGGPVAVNALLDRAESPVALLWRRETDGKRFDTPERKAALDARLRQILARLTDPDLRSHYRSDLSERRAALLQGPSRPGRRSHRPGRTGRVFPDQMALSPSVSARRSALADRSGTASAGRGREAAILLTLIRHPVLLNKHADLLADLELHHTDLDAVRAAILSAWCGAACATHAADAVAVWATTAEGLATVAMLERAPHVTGLGFPRPEARLEDAEQGLTEALDRQTAATLMRREVDEIAAALADDGSDANALEGRLREAIQTAERLSGTQPADDEDDERALADALHNAISRQIWIKRKR
jgi:DNA primase